MATLTHTRGDTLPLVLPLPADATAATLQIHAAGACIEIDGMVNRSRAYFAPAAADSLTPGRVYRTTARTTRADGTTQTIDSFAVLILEGCGDAPAAPSGIVLSGALVEAGADVASGSASVGISLSGAMAEDGSDTASGSLSIVAPGAITLSGALVEAGADTASGEMTVTAPAVAPSFVTQPALLGSPSPGSTITVSLGAASGTPAPTLTGTLTRPGKSAVAVLDGATFQIEASDLGGTITLDVTATNSAGSVTASGEMTADPAPTAAQRVIVLTDYAGDCDDAMALGVACAAHKRGDVEILGVIATSTIETSAPGVYGQLAAYGMQAIPVYAYQGALGAYNNNISAPVRDAFGVPGQTRAAFQDDVTGLRTLLANVPDGSVKVIDIGAPVSGARLLDSPADAISPLTGMQLVAQKVSGLWLMAGRFQDTTTEYNATRHIPSTQRVYHDWPTPVYAHGWEVGANVYTGPNPETDETFDPIHVAFDGSAAAGYINGAGKRNSWDPIAVHHAIYGNGTLYNLAGENGTITVDAAGVTGWTDSPAGNRNRVGKAATNAQIATAIETLVWNAGLETRPDPTVPGQVALPSISGSGDSRTVSWLAPASNGSSITDYVIRLNGAVVSDGIGTGLSYTATGLADGPHSVTVAAVNAVGEGPQSTAAQFTVGASAPNPVASGMVFSLDEGSGAVAVADDGREAQIIGATWAVDPGRLAFNGTSSRLSFPAPSVAGGQLDFVLGALVRFTTTAGTRVIMARSGSGSAHRQFQFRNNAGKLEFVSFPSSGSAAVLTSAAVVFEAGAWAMASAHVMETSATLRVNGTTVHAGTYSAQNRSGEMAKYPLEVGARLGASYADFLAGDIAAFGTKHNAVTADLLTLEDELRAIATAKGITLP